ncbi:MAG: formylglycine-generating enzyme family protein [Candidatus Schekmanbacteria bacterium]|nr:formylglycine-generating enzyme family protein [Candidatus Schekmanbacteria bacterium]
MHTKRALLVWPVVTILAGAGLWLGGCGRHRSASELAAPGGQKSAEAAAALPQAADSRLDPSPAPELPPPGARPPAAPGALPKTVGNWVLIPGGWFMMGIDSSDDEEMSYRLDEKPRHRVWLDDFYLYGHEITVAEHRECIAAGTCAGPLAHDASSPVQRLCNFGAPERDAHPVNCIAWAEAAAHCAWLGGSLPTEAQWEKAARGLDERSYPWGEETPDCDHAVMMKSGWTGCRKGATWPVCSKPDGNSPYGVCDLAGNVAEWTADWFEQLYYETSPASNPTGPADGIIRAVRGGSWNMERKGQHAARRWYEPPESRKYMLGFRCAAEPDKVARQP